VSRDEPGGYPVYWPGGARRRGGVSLVCGCRAEREKARLDTARLSSGNRECPSRECPVGTRVPLPGALADRPVVVRKPLQWGRSEGAGLSVAVVCLINRRCPGGVAWTS
jgi:hypothetical protein